MNRILIKSNFWLHPAKEPSPELYREVENIIFAATKSTNMEVFCAVMRNMELKYFTAHVFDSFKIVEIRTKVETRNYYHPLVMKIQED